MGVQYIVLACLHWHNVISVGPYLGLRGNAGLDVLQWSYDPKVE